MKYINLGSVSHVRKRCASSNVKLEGGAIPKSVDTGRRYARNRCVASTSDGLGVKSSKNP